MIDLVWILCDVCVEVKVFDNGKYVLFFSQKVDGKITFT